jgi:hypothetical protein
MAGQVENYKLLLRRRLLTDEEVAWLRGDGTGSSAFYQCASWALTLIDGERAAGRLDAMAAYAMEQSLVEWRQNTTLLPLVAITFPVPFAYSHLLHVELVVFLLVMCMHAAMFVMSVPSRVGGASTFDPTAWTVEENDETLVASPAFVVRRASAHRTRHHPPPTPRDACAPPAAQVSLVLSSIFVAIVTLIRESLLHLGDHLLDSWSTAGAAFPAEEWLLLPLATHKKLFASLGSPRVPEAYRRTCEPPNDAPPSLFLEPFEPADADFLKAWPDSASGLLKKATATTFRRLDAAGPRLVATTIAGSSWRDTTLARRWLAPRASAQVAAAGVVLGEEQATAGNKSRTTISV